MILAIVSVVRSINKLVEKYLHGGIFTSAKKFLKNVSENEIS